jgi:formylglycine-generating enzyme required for sulfatase activity/catechol 2,3-dioxygenase-like lactoylglutathione lyase family enzyme
MRDVRYVVAWAPVVAFALAAVGLRVSPAPASTPPEAASASERAPAATARVRAGTLRDCALCPELVVVPAGRFTMGSTTINAMRGNEARPEGPVREVTIARAFAAGRTEVTYAQFASFVELAGYRPAGRCRVGLDEERSADLDFRGPILGRKPAPDEPVACVSWIDAKAYAAWLSGLTGQRYRLLTEAEWEYAARAGSTTKWPWGERDLDACRYENTFDLDGAAGLPQGTRLSWEPLGCRDGHGRIAPVASYPPNAFGLHDMLGNVWEWVEDCSFELYPPAPLDGTAVQATGDCEKRAVRGASWYARQDRHRPSFRGRDPQDTAAHQFGFRIARDLGAEVAAPAGTSAPAFTATPTVLVRSPDPAKLAAFYAALGFRPSRTSPNGGVIFLLDGAVGSLEVVRMDPGTRPTTGKTSRTQQGVVAIFETDDPEEVVRRARAAGATLVEPWTASDRPVTIYYVADPENNILGFAPRRHNPRIRTP